MPTAHPPRKFRSDWNQRQYDAYQKRNNEAKSRNGRSPDFATLLHQQNQKILGGKGIQMHQHSQRVLGGAGKLLRYTQQLSSSPAKNITSLLSFLSDTSPQSSTPKVLQTDVLGGILPWYNLLQQEQFIMPNPFAELEREFYAVVEYIRQQWFNETKKITQVAGKIIISKIKEGAELNYILKNGIEKQDLRADFIELDSDTLRTDTKKPSADRFNLYVNFDSYVKLNDEENLKNFKDYESAIIATMMYNMVNGTGPENYYFPENGYISNKFIENKSSILIEALETFLQKGFFSGQPEFKYDALKKDIEITGTIYSITGMTGSAWIDIKDNKERGGVEITIFNVTSITSGSLGKEVDGSSEYWPKSIIRKRKGKTPYGNISQTFNLFIPYSNNPKDKYSKVREMLNKMKQK